MLGLRDLNRTLLARQHLLERVAAKPLELVEHLIGLQAQENLPPYLSLAARIDGFDPHELSDALEERRAVRLLTMRGTIHLLTADDALALRPWVQPALDRASASNQMNKPARVVPVPEVVAATRELLEPRPLPVKELGERLAERFPGVPAAALGHLARERAPLVQLPPRGLWQRSGAVVYQTVENHLGRPTAEVDVRELVRRYLRAFGPATPADMTTWSRVTRLGPVFASMRDELLTVDCEDGRTRYDVPGAPYVDGEERVPVRLLGAYDNLWLSHADRAHIVPAEVRSRWAGTNGGVGSTVFVDGFMAGLWWWRDGRVVIELFTTPTEQDRAELEEEVRRVGALLGANARSGR
ncbi:MAG TPA: winged helix DNA-binding domain-containing protein [Marmoricola sp.]|nr:winged helix DNA-binding domain-containing protein [Marmoricola sp.]